MMAHFLCHFIRRHFWITVKCVEYICLSCLWASRQLTLAKRMQLTHLCDFVEHYKVLVAVQWLTICFACILKHNV